MRTLKYIYLLLPLMILCICVNMADAQEAKYIGEFCFTMTSSFGSSVETLQVGVLSYGEGHLPLDGKVTVEGPFLPKPTHGSAMLFNGSVLATLTAAGAPGTFSKTYYLQGDLATLSGIYTVIEFYNIGTGPPPQRNQYFTLTDNGTITRITCP